MASWLQVPHNNVMLWRQWMHRQSCLPDKKYFTPVLSSRRHKDTARHPHLPASPRSSTMPHKPCPSIPAPRCPSTDMHQLQHHTLQQPQTQILMFPFLLTSSQP